MGTVNVWLENPVLSTIADWRKNVSNSIVDKFRFFFLRLVLLFSALSLHLQQIIHVSALKSTKTGFNYFFGRVSHLKS